MAEPITTKRRMYELLRSGRLGNTVPGWPSVAAWEASAEYPKFDWWGVRTLAPGGPCRLHCPKSEIRGTAESFIARGYGIDISIMVDRVATVTLWAEVADLPGGRVVYGIEYPPHGASWRALMPSEGRHWTGTAARLLLRRHMDPNSLGDMEELLETYPGHVYEFSALSRELGTHPGRNCICWEVRGGY